MKKALWVTAFKRQVHLTKSMERRRTYKTRSRLFVKRNPKCQVCRRFKTESVHHMRGRLGELLIDERYWLAVCPLCHRLIHDKPDWARENGWLAKRGDWCRV